MGLPSIRLEIHHGPRPRVVRWSPPSSGMRAMNVKVDLEFEQLVFKIGGCPEQRVIQILAADGADQPLHKGMGQRNVGHGLDLAHV